MREFDYDLAVLGGGSAGYAAARTTAAAGRKTIVLEGGPDVGGLCILRGCMPTKALLYAAEVHHLARHADTWGINTGPVTFDFPRVMARKRALIEDFASYRRGQLTSGKFVFQRAHAAFTDPHTLQLSTGERVTARHFLLATGSVVAPPPLPQLRDVGYLTSDEVLELESLPESLIILGGGAVAVEFAQFFQRFGVAVTLLQRHEHLLRDFDTDTASELEKVLRREGMTIHTNTRLLEARRENRHENGRENSRKIVAFEKAGQRHEVAAAEILFALGRTPNTASLELARAGVALDGARIITNDRQQTSAPHIYAAGDCTGPYEIVHLAIQQGEIAAHNILHPDQPRAIDYRLLTSVVFTDPQIATVGLTEKSARAAKLPFLAASYPFNDHGKSLIMEARDGFVKLLADPVTGEILGGSCIGPLGGELIHEIIVAMAQRMTVHELAAVPHYHPTLAEIWTYPAEDLASQIPGAETR